MCQNDKIRNTNIEIRNKSKMQNRNDENRFEFAFLDFRFV